MIIIDDFLSDHHWDQFTHEGLWYKPKTYEWLGMDQPKRSVWDEIATHIWMHVDANYSNHIELGSFDGVEHWTNIMNPESFPDLPLHYDKDEYLWRETGEICVPKIGSVLYAHDSQPEGGYLELVDENGVSERIAPIPNRLIIFPSGLPHQVTETTSGIRKVFATNVWGTMPSYQNFL
jgi:hypothetical protein